MGFKVRDLHSNPASESAHLAALRKLLAFSFSELFSLLQKLRLITPISCRVAGKIRDDVYKVRSTEPAPQDTLNICNIQDTLISIVLESWN